MSKLVRLISCDDVPEGSSAEVTAEGKIFAVFNVVGTFHVLDGVCPHAGGPLGKGSLTGNVVTCPWHGWQFDVATGMNCLNHSMCQPGYTTSIIDDVVCVEIPE